MALVVSILILATVGVTAGQRNPRDYAQYLPLMVAVASLVSASWPQCEGDSRRVRRPSRGPAADLEAGSGYIQLPSRAAATSPSERSLGQWLDSNVATRSNFSDVTGQLRYMGGGVIGLSRGPSEGSEGSGTSVDVLNGISNAGESESQSPSPHQQPGASMPSPERGPSPQLSTRSIHSDHQLLDGSSPDRLLYE